MKVILMDIDDTLMDFEQCSYKAIQSALLLCGWIMSDDFFYKFTQLNNQLWRDYAEGKIEKKILMNIRWEILFKEEKININPVGFDDIFQSQLKQQYVLIDGAKELMEYLSSKYNVFVASNGIATGQEYRLKQSGLYDYFQSMFVSDEIGYPKPQKEFFDYCIDHLSCQRDEIMIIGDSLEADIVGGINAGIKTCWVNLKNKKTDLKIDYEVHSLKEIREFL